MTSLRSACASRAPPTSASVSRRDGGVARKRVRVAPPRDRSGPRTALGAHGHIEFRRKLPRLLDPPDGGQLVVRTSATVTGVALDLIDTGVGMDAKTASQIFETFFSTKPGGSGLGLPTTLKIVEAHGGRIDVQSAPGRGTQFTIELPLPARLTAH